jgi:hypothetical protein
MLPDAQRGWMDYPDHTVGELMLAELATPGSTRRTAAGAGANRLDYPAAG